MRSDPLELWSDPLEGTVTTIIAGTLVDLMPRQGSNKRKALENPEETPEAKKLREEVESGFRLQCKAALFTWITPTEVSAGDALDLFMHMPHWELVQNFTICAEEGTHWHVHAYLEFKKRVDHAASGWMCWDAKPDVRSNTTTGSGYNTAVRRGSFYVANEYKKTFRSHVMNFYPGEHYTVKTQWVIDQWAQNKLRDPIKCAGQYRCLTRSFKELVTMSQGTRDSIERAEYMSERNLELAQERKEFKVYAEVSEFLAQFVRHRPRYKFLWIWGESMLGKTELAKSLVEKYWHHRNSINWAEYSALENSAIIFDDCGNAEDYITNHKMLFQANCVTTVNTSRTNCYALEVDTTGKMIIVCANHPPCTTWVMVNSIILIVREPTWVC